MAYSEHFIEHVPREARRRVTREQVVAELGEVKSTINAGARGVLASRRMNSMPSTCPIC